MAERSARREVRNPVLGLPAIAKLQALPPDARVAVEELLADVTADARGRAQASWLKNKGPMAAYWKAVGAYSNHIRNAIRSRPSC